MEVADQQRDLEVLINGLKAMAKDRLEAREEFSPWAVWMKPNGQVLATAVGRGGEDQVPLLYQALTRRREEFRAVAVVVTLGDDAGMSVIRFECEHRDGLAVAVATPWIRDLTGTAVKLMQSQFIPHARQIWA